MKKIYTSKAPEPVGPYSQAVLANGMLYTSGQIALNPKTNEITGKTAAEQTEQVCKNIGAVLEAVGLSFGDVIKTMCFIDDMADFAEFNNVYKNYFTSSPARSCVAAKQLPKGALVEIEVIAVANQQN